MNAVGWFWQRYLLYAISKENQFQQQQQPHTTALLHIFDKRFFVDVGGIKALISKKTAAVHYDSYIEQHMFLTKKRVEEEALTTYFIGPFLFKREGLQRAFSL